jgi:hypothetical protein
MTPAAAAAKPERQPHQEVRGSGGAAAARRANVRTVEVPFVVIGIAIVALFVAIAIGAHRAAVARREAMRELADELGLVFDDGRDHSHDDEYRQFAVFRRGDDRYAYNTLRGTIQLLGQACPLVAGDFHYEEKTGAGKNRRTTSYHFSFVVVRPPLPTPCLLVRPEGLFDKIKAAFGFDDIDFESAEFSRRFFVQSSDKRFAYDVLHPRMMELLLAEKPPTIEIQRGALCLTDGNVRWSPEQFRVQLRFLGRFYAQWPRHRLTSLTTSPN